MPDRSSRFVRTQARGRAGTGADPTQAARRLLPTPEGHAALDRIAALAARLVGAPAAQISLLTDVQTVAGGTGLPAGAIGSTGPLRDSLCTVTAAGGVPLLAPDARDDDRVNTLPPVTSGQVGAYLGVPLRSDAGEIVGALCVLDPDRREWHDADVRVLEQLCDFVRAELELAALGRELDDNETRWNLAVEAGDVGSFDWNLDSEELIWDDRLIAMFGYEAGDVAFDRTIASFEARIHPEDAPRVDDAMSSAITSVGRLHIVYRIVLPSGAMRWVEARGRALAGPNGAADRLIGVAWDITEDRAREARADRVLASMTVGYLSMDASGRIDFVNDEGARLLGARAPDLIGRSVQEAFPGAVDSVLESTYRRVLSTGRAETIEAYYPEPRNAWYEIRATAENDGVALYFLDVTARRHSLELLQLSVDVSEHMVGAVSVEAAVSALARMAVPGLADWSIVTLIDVDGHARDVQSWHADPALRRTVSRYSATRLEGGGSGVIDTVVREGEPVEVMSDVAGFGGRTLQSEIAKDALRALDAESAVAVPMLAGGVVGGVLTLVRGPGRLPMSAQELAVTVSLCRRAGLAIDNARLYAAQAASALHDRSVAEALQQALLTTLPAAPGLELAARYVAAADGDRVGGDWYDALVHPDGDATVMIGDVLGHDIAAAAIMGQFRTMLRMLALRRDDSPAQMLQALDESARALDVRTLATVVSARILPGPDHRTLWWSNAGHPPPVLLHADGSTDVLWGSGPDALVGLRDATLRADHHCPLPGGSTLLLYTDGLVERRGDSIDDGIASLCRALTTHHRLGLDDLLDEVLADVVGGERGDDVAVLAVRLGGG